MEKQQAQWHRSSQLSGEARGPVNTPVPDTCLHIRFGKFAVSGARRECCSCVTPPSPSSKPGASPAFPAVCNYVDNAGFQGKAEAPHPRWLAPGCGKRSQVRAVAVELGSCRQSPAQQAQQHPTAGTAAPPAQTGPSALVCIPNVPFAGCKGPHAIYPQHYQTRSKPVRKCF